MEYITQYEKLLRIKRYSKSTIKTYTGHVKNFIKYFKKSDVQKLNEENIFRYLEHKIVDENISFSHQKGILGAITLFYKLTFDRKININYIHPDRLEYKLPNVLSQNEIKKIINRINNIKHKTIISLIYSAGLRISEVVNLKIQDIDSERMVIKIVTSKNNRDRYVTLSSKVLILLRELLRKSMTNFVKSGTKKKKTMKVNSLELAKQIQSIILRPHTY